MLTLGGSCLEHLAVPEGKEVLHEQTRSPRGYRHVDRAQEVPSPAPEAGPEDNTCAPGETVPAGHTRGSQPGGGLGHLVFWGERRKLRSVESAPAQCPARSDCPQVTAGPSLAGFLGKRLRGSRLRNPLSVKCSGS